jgi:hypothetical protein
MKNVLVIIIAFTAVPHLASSQANQIKPDSLKADNTKKNITNTKKGNVNTLIADDPSTDDDYGWTNRFAFMVGGGASVALDKIYLDPAINKTNNAVIIEEAKRLKPNITLGIVYTPFVSTYIREVKIKKNNKEETLTLYRYAPRGVSIALFLNPISLTKLSDTGLGNTVDLGMGLGWRSGNFSIFGTVEFYSLRQPRDYFINQFKDNNKPYIVNGQTQTSISTNDNDVFKSPVIPALGLKIAYTLDVVKNFTKAVSAQ